eukprot:COSAG06_NODE_22336_length_726_cov_3.993620_1_plen_37_part_10
MCNCCSQEQEQEGRWQRKGRRYRMIRREEVHRHVDRG